MRLKKCKYTPIIDPIVGALSVLFFREKINSVLYSTLMLPYINDFII